MLALATTNAVGAVLFGVLYAVAGARFMSQGAFLACLMVIFALVTGLWVRAEARHGTISPSRRIGRAIGALALALVVVPVAVLAPAFWLDEQLPAEAGLTRQLGPIMTLVLVSLTLVLLTNVVGAAVVCVRSLRVTRRSS